VRFADHLEYSIPQWLTHMLGGRLGSNPLRLVCVLVVLFGAIVAAAVPIVESTVILYNAATRGEVRLNERRGLSREPPSVPGRPSNWVHVCNGTFAVAPSELTALRRQRSHHAAFLAAVGVGVAMLWPGFRPDTA
jgi:hypothetical protein